MRKLGKTENTIFGPLLNFAQSHLTEFCDLSNKADINQLQSSQAVNKSEFAWISPKTPWENGKIRRERRFCWFFKILITHQQSFRFGKMAYGLMGIIEGLSRVWVVLIFEVPPMGYLRKTQKNTFWPLLTPITFDPNRPFWSLIAVMVRLNYGHPLVPVNRRDLLFCKSYSMLNGHWSALFRRAYLCLM